MQNVHARVASDLERASGSKSSLKPLPSKRLPVDPIPLPSTKRMKADLEEKPVKVELEEAPATALVKKELLNSEDHPNTIQENPPPNLPADDEPPPNLPADDETKLSKKELIEKHRLTVHPQGWKGKNTPCGVKYVPSASKVETGPVCGSTAMGRSIASSFARQ